MAVCAGEKGGGGAEWHATPTQLQAANTPLHSMIISKRNYSAVCGLRLVGVAGRRGGWGEGVDGGCAGWLCGRLAVTLATHHNHPGPPTHTPRVHTSPPCTLHPPTNALAAHHIVCTKAQADADRQWPLAGGGGVRGCSQGDWKASRWSWPGFWWPPVRCSQRVHGKTALPAPQPTRTTHTN